MDCHFKTKRMRTQHLIFTCLLFFLTIGNLSAQENKAKLGIQASNLFTFTFNNEEDFFKSNGIIRYSIGGFFRKTLGRGIRVPKIFNSGPRSGVIAFDYGVNLVFKGYEFQAGKILNTSDQLSVEFPLLLVFYDRKNVFMPRKWYRKGIAGYGRMGLKPSYLFNQNYSVNTANGNNEFLEEQTQSGGLNILWKLGMGILKQKKNGPISFLEFSANIGFIVRSETELAYEDTSNNISRATTIKSNGTYFDLKVGYIFYTLKPSIQNRGEKTPLIYNPRF